MIMTLEESGLVDYHTHPYAHGEKEVTLSELKSFVNQAEKRGLKELGFSDHDMLLEEIEWKKLKSIRDNTDLSLKLGLEIDYKPGKEKQIKKWLRKFPLDYCIGSVHFIGEWNFDHPDYRDRFEQRNIDEIYRNYYQLLERAVNTDLFDIVGHFDLVKIFNFYPKQLSLSSLVEPVLDKIKEQGLVIEINTNGLNKPVQEIYPSPKIIKWMKEKEIPVTLGSDAHQAGRVGENFEQMVQVLKKTGYEKIAVFKNRQQNFIKLPEIQ